MKLILRIFFFFAISTKLFSQILVNDKVTYLDSSWVETNAENSKYTRVVENYYSDQKSYVFKDYFKSKKIRMIGNSSDRDILRQEGQFIYYYENGNKESTINYSNKKKNGKEFNWYENGILKEEGEYNVDEKKKTSVYKVNQFWNSKGEQKVINGNGDYEEIGEKSFASGKVKNGFKDGLWQGYDKKVGYTFSETYENQKLVSGVSTDTKKTTHNYTVIEKKPEPKNGFMEFYQYLGKNFSKANLPKGINGKIVTRFIVDKEGRLVEPKILKSFGYGADEEAIRVITNSEKWLPGEIRGIKVRCSYSQPIVIQTSK